MASTDVVHVRAVGSVAFMIAMAPGGPNDVDLQLKEFDLFIPGEKKVRMLGDHGEVLSEHPILDRFFDGKVLDGNGGRAYIQIAPTGLYGAVVVNHAEWSLQPITSLDPPGPSIVQEIVVPDSATQTEAAVKDIESGLLAAGVAGQATLKNLDSKPYAEPAFRSDYSDYASRISSSYGWGVDMWKSETSIQLRLYSVDATPRNFYGNSCGGVGDSGLYDFRNNWLGSYAWAPGPNAYALFSSWTNPGSGVAGCSTGPNIQAYNAYTPNYWASETVMGHDWYQTDSYNPSNTNHMGLSVNHELTHLASDSTHDSNNGLCNFNIMMNKVAFQCSYFWRVQSRINLVMSTGYPILANA